MKKYFFNTNIVVALLTILVLYTFFLYPQSLNSLVIGSYSSVQLVQTQKYIVNFLYNLSYPFIFNLGNGFDLIADSPQSVLHPLYIIINIFLEDKFLIQSIFVKIHMLFFICGLLLYLQNKINNFTILILLIFSLTNSMAFTTNISHPFFISVYSYFPFVLYFLDKIIKYSKKKYFIIFTVLIIMMLLIGHFQHQFIFLCFLMIYLIQNLLKKSLSLKNFFEILFCIFIAFIICLPQLLPVLDLMLIGERSNIGGIGRFSQSLSGLGISGYFFPGINWIFFKNFPNFYNTFSTGPSLIEGLHYLGLIPLIIFFFILNKMRKEIAYDAVFLSISFLVLRAFGIFFIFNILLNYLPIFGQFRAPIRNLYLVDFLIIIFIGINFNKYFSLDEFKNFLINFYKYLTIFILILLTVIFFLSYKSHVNLELNDFLLAFFGYITVGLFIICNKYIKNKKTIFLTILLLSVADIYFYKVITPLNSKIVNNEDAKFKINYYDNLCKNENVNKIISIFDHSVIKNDLPRFIYGKKENNHFLLSKNDKKNEISTGGKYIASYECDISLTIKIITLATLNSNKFNNMFFLNNDYSVKDKIYISKLLGFNSYLDFQNNKLKIYNVNSISNYDKTKINNLIVKDFLNEKNSKNGLFDFKLNKIIYDKLKQIKLDKFIPNSKVIVNKINNKKFIPYGSARNYLIEDLNGNFINYKFKDPFIEVKTEQDELRIYYIPSPFLVGLALILPLLILFLIIKKVFFFLMDKFSSEYFEINKIKNFQLDLKKIFKLFSFALIPLSIFCITYLVVMGTQEINLNSYNGKTLILSFLFFIHFISSIWFMKKIVLVNSNKNINYFIYNFISFNILFGMTLWSEMTIYEGPKYLIEILGFDEKNIILIKQMISNIW